MLKNKKGNFPRICSTKIILIEKKQKLGLKNQDSEMELLESQRLQMTCLWEKTKHSEIERNSYMFQILQSLG